MTSRTVTLSVDNKVCDIMNFTTLTILDMYPALTLGIIPINSNTAAVCSASIKTQLQCWRCRVLPSAKWLHGRIHGPARWTADTRRRWCRTEPVI